MKYLRYSILAFFLFCSGMNAQKLLVNGMVGFPSSDFAFAANSSISNIAYGGSIGYEHNLSNLISGYVSIGGVFLEQKGIRDVSTIIPVMAGIKFNLGAGGFLPFLGAEIGYEYSQYNDVFLGKRTIKEPEIATFLGLEVPLTSKISWLIGGKYSFVLSVFRTNSLFSANTGLAFSLY